MSQRNPLSDLESTICDLVDMVALATAYTEDAIGSSVQPTIEITVRQRDLIMFGLYRIGRMARELKGEFYERLKPDNPGPAARRRRVYSIDGHCGLKVGSGGRSKLIGGLGSFLPEFDGKQ